MSKNTQCALMLLGVLLGPGCKSGDEGDSHGHEEGIYPEQLYTGFDGVTEFKVPAIFTGEESVTWTLENPALASLTTVDKVVTLKVLAPGNTRLVAKTDTNETFTASVTITTYAAGKVDQGKNLYGPAGANCIACHSAADSPDHTPSEIGSHNDATLADMIQLGKTPHNEMKSFHMFAKAAGEVDAYIAYIRSLPPRGVPQPHLDDEHAGAH